MREWNRIKVDQELVGKEKEKVGMEKEELMEQVSRMVAGQVELEGEEDGDASNAGACANAALDIAATTLLLPADT